MLIELITCFSLIILAMDFLVLFDSIDFILSKASSLWNDLPIGTKSVLFGAHCFFLHPFFVAAGWTKLYGFPFDPRLWVAFFVHDIGYWGCPDMDGEIGERHVEFGARIMSAFDNSHPHISHREYWDRSLRTKWHDFSLYHSRHYAKMHGAAPSRLCFADKLAFNYQIKPLYLWMTKLTGELDEYLFNAKFWRGGEYISDPCHESSRLSASIWYDDLVMWIEKYIAEFKDGAEDTVTVDRRTSESKY